MFRNVSNGFIIGTIIVIGLFSLANYSDSIFQHDLTQPQSSNNTNYSSTSLPTATLKPVPTSGSTTFSNLYNPGQSGEQPLIAFIDAPAGLQTSPYVILTAYASNGMPGIDIKIQGDLVDQTFLCSNAPCKLPVKADTVINFQALTDTGLISNIVQANISVTKKGDQYSVTIGSVSQFVFFTDACSGMWGTSASNTQSWSNYFQNPSQLNTGKKLHLLATKLITNGIVDAKSCPGGGLDANGAPNPCGLDKVYPALVIWQNKYDFSIWAASRDIHIPPRIIKTLIETESQFWPSNERYYLDEIGLGQMNQLGMDIILRNNPDIYFKLCSQVLGNCTQSYTSLPRQLQAMIRGALVDTINATCQNCAYGLDFNKANQSIDLMALLLKATCDQVKTAMENVGATAVNQDMWKFTIASYHSGIGCVQSAIEQASTTTKSLTWDSVSAKLYCYGGKSYVDNFWNTLNTIDNYVLAPGNAFVSLTDATLGTSQSFLPTPTVVIRNIHVLVNVFQDKNANGKMDTGEAINNIVVELDLEDGTSLSKSTQDGKVDFDMSNYRPGITIIASLPGYYQYKAVTLPENGSVSVDFIFTSAVP